MITIVISNQKGGVGKTTTAVTFADGLARRGMKVLLVDLDSQGNVADCLGISEGADLARLLNPVIPETLNRCTFACRTNLAVIRSNKTTVALKTALAGMDFREMVLAQALEAGQGNYDLAILDCAPSMDVLHTAALVAADFLVIPTRLDQLAVKGVRDLLVSLQEIHKMQRSLCQLIGILPTFYDRVTGESQAQLEHLVANFRRFVWPPIPVDTVCREASRVGKTLYEYAPECRAMVGVRNIGGKRAGGYLQATERLLECLK